MKTTSLKVTMSQRDGAELHKADGSRPLALDPFVALQFDVVRRAAMRVSQHWLGDGNEIVAAQDVIFEILELSRSVENPTASSLRLDTDSTTLTLRSRLLEELRHEILHEWQANGAPGSSELLCILSGLDHTQSLIEPPSADIVAKRLADAGGLDLVVEVAHDLRSPLTSILFLSDSMLRGQSGELTPLQKQQLSIIDAAALRLVNTATDVIELARGGEYLKTNQPLPFSLREILDPVRDLVKPMADQKGVVLSVTSTASDRRVGLPVPLARVLLNLASNALKFTRDQVEIVATPASPTRLEFSVRDNGGGIEAEALKTLFHPLRRRGTSRPGYQFSGTGLALNICRKLVRSMGGELQLETASDWGTRFFFEVDMPPAPDSQPTA